MNAGAHAETIFFSDTKLLTTLPLKKYPSIQLYQVQYGKIQLWSDLTTSPGIMGINNIIKYVFEIQTLISCGFNYPLIKVFLM